MCSSKHLKVFSEQSFVFPLKSKEENISTTFKPLIQPIQESKWILDKSTETNLVQHLYTYR